MCGISGIINFNQPKKNSSGLHQMNNSMVNRGPDDEGYVLFNNDTYQTYYGNDSIHKDTSHIETSYNNAYNLGFGFRHLKIMDVSTQNKQPMADKSANFWIVFNGEIYNHKEIRKELELLGHHFTSSSDTEVVLKSYIEWQEKALLKFNGMFAFTIYNRTKNEVFCARDRIGIKPFYYVNNNNTFIFGSSTQAILASKEIQAEVATTGLIENFKYGATQNPKTPFKNIVALEPGHFLTLSIDTQEIFKSQYWKIPTNTQIKNMSFNDAHDLLEEALQKSIKYRLHSDNIHTGTYLSGGIDSSLISAIASKNINNLKSFTLGFKNDKDLNEIAQAKETAKKHNIEHFISDPSANNLIEDIYNSVAAYEEPYHNIDANYQLAKMAHQHKTRVVLNGLGADELLGGYDCYKKLSLWKKLQPFSSITSKLPLISNKLKKITEYSSYKSINAFYNHFYTIFSDVELQELFNKDTPISNPFIQFEQHQKFSDDFEALSFLNLKSYIGNHHTNVVDKTGMAFSVEARFPFLDHHLIETAFSIPTKHKYHKGIKKFVLKEISKKYLPEKVLKMPKKGLSMPLENLVHKELFNFKTDHLNLLKKRHLLSTEGINKIISAKDEHKIWQLVATEIWLQKFIDN